MTIFSVFTVIGGLAFFLFGMHLMSGSLSKMAGGRLDALLKKMTEKPLVSLLLGAVITIAMQSSSATTVMLVGLVNSGILEFAKTVYVCFGANIGTTLTGWILSLAGIEGENFFLQLLKPVNFSPILAFVGAMLLLFSKKERKKSVGTVFLGFAVLMYGMTLMSDAVAPLADSPAFGDLLAGLKNPLVGLLAALVFTAIVQSSAATIGILQALSIAGVMPISTVVPLVMGLNIGTCATSMLSAIGTGTGAKRVSTAHLLIKVLGTAVCLPVFLLTKGFFPNAWMESAATPVTIALIHTLFNVLVTVILLPVTKLIVKLTEKLVPEQSAKKEKDFCWLDERLFLSPSVAIAECSRLTDEMATYAKDIMGKSLSLFGGWNPATEKEILALEDKLDHMQDRLGTYLVRLSPLAVSGKDSQKISKMMHTVGDFERLGDHAINLLELFREMYEKKSNFSEEAQKEFSVLSKATSEIIRRTEFAFCSNDLEVAASVEPLEQVIDGLTDQIRDRHIARLQAGKCSMKLDFWLSEFLINFERISDHCSNVAVAVIEASQDSFDTHEYLNNQKDNSSAFRESFQKFEDMYRI